MTLSIKAVGTGTLPASGPGVQSTVTVTNLSIASTHKVILTLTKRVADSEEHFDAYVDSVGTGSFVAASNKNQLPETLTFNYIAFASA